MNKLCIHEYFFFTLTSNEQTLPSDKGHEMQLKALVENVDFESQMLQKL